MGLSVGGFSLRAMCIGTRWARMDGGFPEKMKDWSSNHTRYFESICKEIDRRHDARRGLV